jgi:prepilin-type N-terminal cleavage/methylation domain-containing protein
MKNQRLSGPGVLQGRAGHGRYAGFTLIELMVAMLIFVIIGGTALSLFKVHTSQFTDQQNQVALNTSLRNSLSQIEVDLSNAGTGYYVTTDKASFPVGVTVISGGGGAGGCNAGQTYTAACFDQVNIVTTDSSTPPGLPNIGDGVTCTDTNAQGTAWVTVPQVVNPATGALWLPADYAAKFSANDQIVFSSGQTANYNTTRLTGAPAVVGNQVSLPHYATSAATLANNTTTDPLHISTFNDPQLATSFCPNTDWVVRLAPEIIYGVDLTNPADPQLYRQVGQAGARVFLADQIIGFRIFATQNDNQVKSSSDFAAGNYQFNVIRTIKVSIMGRTPPNPVSSFRNTFDGGAYRIEALSVTANPRNLSMND